MAVSLVLTNGMSAEVVCYSEPRFLRSRYAFSILFKAPGDGRTYKWEKLGCMSHGREESHLPSRSTHLEMLHGRNKFLLCLSFYKFEVSFLLQ